MDIEVIRERVRVGNYLVKSHAVQHALKEGFERKHVIEAILKKTLHSGDADDRECNL